MASRRLLAKLSGDGGYTGAQWSRSVSPTFTYNASLWGIQSQSHRGSSKGFNADMRPDVTTTTMHAFSRNHDEHNSDKSHKPLPSTSGSISSLCFRTNAYSSLGFAVSGCVGGWNVNRVGLRYASSSSGSAIEGSENIPEYIHTLGEQSIDIAVDKTQAVSEVAAAAADSSLLSAGLQYFIEYVHIHTGLAWWASIAATTILIRCLTIPVLISQLKTTTRLTMMNPKMEEIKNSFLKSSDPETIEEGRRRMMNLFKQYNVTPWAPLKGLIIQFPVFISFYFAVTNMAANVPSFKEGGALWFQDLSTPDTLYLLPALTALSFLATVELNMQEGLEGNPMAGKMKMFSRFIALMTVPITMNFPKAIFCYWITSNLFSLMYGAVIKKPGIKAALGIPKILVPPPSAAENIVESSTLIAKERPSSSLIHHRLRDVEKTVKAKRRIKKR